MDGLDAPRPTRHPLLDGQIRLLRDRRKDVANLLQEPDDARDQVAIDRIANDLVGARLVLRAVLKASPPCGVSGALREELERREREAGDLLRAVLATPRPS